MKIKKILLLMGAGLGIGVVVILGCFVNFMWFFSYEISENLCIEQVSRQNQYNLVQCSNAALYVANVDGWIIKGKQIYGSHQGNQFFWLEAPGKTVTLFDSLTEINDFLEQKGLPAYDLSAEENISHLKYGGGRNRVY